MIYIPELAMNVQDSWIIWFLLSLFLNFLKPSLFSIFTEIFHYVLSLKSYPNINFQLHLSSMFFPKKQLVWVTIYYNVTLYKWSQMTTQLETSETKWVNSILNTIGVNSLRFRGHQLFYCSIVNTWSLNTYIM